MKVQQLAGAALFAVVAIGLVSWSLLTTKREQNQQQEKVELEQKLPFLQVTGKIGGEKVGFLSDLEVIRILRERYRLEVKANTVELTVKSWQAVGYFALSPCGRGVAPVNSTLRTRRLVVPSPPHPNPLPRGEREPEVPSDKGVIADSTVLRLRLRNPGPWP
jgi:hypothetical protein